MKRFFLIILTVSCLTAFVTEICYSDSLPSKGNSGAVKEDGRKHDKDAVTDKSKRDSSDEKTKDKDMEEPEYDMDLEIDFKDERC